MSIEESADKVAATPIEITIGEKVYEVAPLRGSHYAKIKARIRGRGITAIMNTPDMDPISKRFAVAIASERPISMEAILEEMISPDMSSWIVWMVLKEQKENRSLKIEEVEELPVMSLMEVIMAISGLSTSEEEAKKALKGQGPTDSTGES